MDKIRHAVQAGFVLLTNSYLVGFLTGKIYQGPGKNVCLPGLNCYSCPGALGSCPIGALQAVSNEKNFSLSLYVGGFLILVGALMGRLVCGWLCPFGLFQDLLHKLPVPGKLRNIPGDRILKNLKYIMLVVFVILLPTVVQNEFGIGTPWFCEYVCPSGTLMAGWPLLLANESLRGAVGLLFGWKSLILVGFIAASLWIYRPFCRWVCPLGAIYGFFNRVSIYRHHFEAASCDDCGSCRTACRLDLDPSKAPNSMECIRCGDCIKACPNHALQVKILQTSQKYKSLHESGK